MYAKETLSMHERIMSNAWIMIRNQVRFKLDKDNNPFFQEVKSN